MKIKRSKNGCTTVSVAGPHIFRVVDGGNYNTVFNEVRYIKTGAYWNVFGLEVVFGGKKKKIKRVFRQTYFSWTNQCISFLLNYLGEEE